MKSVTALLEKAGCGEVRTYIQSGNAVFRSAASSPEGLAERVGRLISDSHGFRPRVLILRGKELEKAAASNPFPKAESKPATLHLYFLTAKPLAPDLDSIKEAKARSESFVLAGKVFYLHAPEGIGRSKLAGRVEKLLRVEATARNWATVSKLIELVKET